MGLGVDDAGDDEATRRVDRLLGRREEVVLRQVHDPAVLDADADAPATLRGDDGAADDPLDLRVVGGHRPVCHRVR
jgi:copper oxidase (laccase) domain-containing protein